MPAKEKGAAVIDAYMTWESKARHKSKSCDEGVFIRVCCAGTRDTTTKNVKRIIMQIMDALAYGRRREAFRRFAHNTPAAPRG